MTTIAIQLDEKLQNWDVETAQEAIVFGTKVASRIFLDIGLASEGECCHLGEHDDWKAEDQGPGYHRLEVFRAARAAAGTFAR